MSEKKKIDNFWGRCDHRPTGELFPVPTVLNNGLVDRGALYWRGRRHVGGGGGALRTGGTL
jgi:hypothetical protein